MANVVVKTKYLPAGRAAGYAEYMAKDKSEAQAAANVSAYMQSHGGQGHSGRAELFTRDGEAVNVERFTRDSQNDPRVWTVIVSPAHGNDLDLQAFARTFMAQVEADTNRTVDWLGVQHKNTDHHHIHLLIRGRDRRGKVLNFPPAYIQRGMRHRAMALQHQILSQRQSLKASTPAHESIPQVVQTVTPRRGPVATRGGSLGW